MRLFITRIIILLMLIMGIPNVAQTSLDEAQLAYDAGNYEAAISLYEFVLLNDNNNGAIYTNLGHAYYLNGQSGKALQNYLRAAQLLPRNAVIAEQIVLIRAERDDEIIGQSDWVNATYTLTADYVTISELSLSIFILWVLLFGMMSIRIKRQGLGIPISILGIIVFIGLGLLGTRLYLDYERPSAVVLVDDVQVMSGPDTSYLELFTLHEAMELRIVENREDWVRFALPDGRQGWVMSDHIGLIAS